MTLVSEYAAGALGARVMVLGIAKSGTRLVGAVHVLGMGKTRLKVPVPVIALNRPTSPPSWAS
jgi:hypothetical protein